MFILLLENCKVDFFLLGENLVDYVIKYVMFWIYILGVKGKFKILIEEYLMYLLMKYIYVDMLKSF